MVEINKLILNGVTQMDVTPTTADTADVVSPKVFVGADGELKTGTGSGGGGGGGNPVAEENDVNFIDYDGTIRYSYSAADFAQLDALPANPTHDKVTGQGWNWTLSDAKAYASTHRRLYIGQQYITKSGNTEIDVSFPDAARLSPTLTLAVNGTVSVDWGDNSPRESLTGTSLSTRLSATHTYALAGDYTISIIWVSGYYTFYGGSADYSILRKDTTGNNNRVYANCIKRIRIGNGVPYFGVFAFNNCYSLSSITIPTSVSSLHTGTSTDGSAFLNCYSLVSISLPSGVFPTIANTFSYCYSLASVSLPYGGTKIGNSTFANCNSLDRISIPSSVTQIGNYAFNNCRSLAAIDIPSGVSTLFTYTFSGCYALTALNIPSSITEINTYSFSSCYGLGAVRFESSTPPSILGTSAFTGMPTDCIIYVPSGSLSAYTSANNYPSSSTYTYVEY